MKEILNVIHNTIYQFFDVCKDEEEVPMSDKDKLLLEVNQAICNNLKVLEQKEGYSKRLWKSAYERGKADAEQKWIPVSERLPEEDGDYFVTYEKGYAEDYNFPPIGIAGFDVDCESFGYWYEQFDRHTLGSLGGDWEEIKVIAWMPLPEPYKAESEDKE